jgi:hypothetical protein
MSVVSMSGNDTVILNNRIFADFADGTIAELKFATPIAELSVGKNGNAIYALNEEGNRADLTIKLVRASSDDVFMNQLLIAQQSNFPGTVLLAGQFIKLSGDGQGTITQDVYLLSGGIFVQEVDSFSNVEGDVQQSTSVYNLQFAAAARAIA